MLGIPVSILALRFADCSDWLESIPIPEQLPPALGEIFPASASPAILSLSARKYPELSKPRQSETRPNLQRVAVQ